MKFNLLYGIFFLGIIACSSIDKERLELDRQILEFDKEKFKLEQSRYKNCNCCEEKKTSCCESKNTIKIISQDQTTTKNDKLIIATEKTSDCDKITTPRSEEIWALSIEGGWSFAPQKLETGDTNSCDKKESFYKQFSNTESYVAEKQVPKTKKSSCTNNVLFHGKDKLYNLMIDKTLKEDSTEADSTKLDKPKLLSEIIQYNNEGKKRSFYYECMPTDPEKRWDKCTCVLYASYPNGKSGLIDRIRKF
jgi:hypothetical protein